MSWKPYAQALLRGGVRGMTLGGGAAKAVADLVRKYDDVVEEQAVPSIQGYIGSDLPPRGIRGAIPVGGAEQLAAAAWADVRAGDQEDLTQQVQELLAASDEESQRRVMNRLARKMPTALMRHEPLRRLLTGSGGGGSAGGGSAGGVGLKVMAGIGCLGFVGALLGYVGTQPKIDRQAPRVTLSVEGGGSVRGRSVEISGVIDELNLVEVSVDGVTVPTEEPKPARYTFKTRVELKTLGKRTIEIVARDNKDLVTKQSVEIERLPFPIQLSLSEPRHAVRGGPTRVKGRATCEAKIASVTINGERLRLAADGTFSGEVQLPATSSRQHLRIEASGPQALGTLEETILIDHDAPKLEVQPHDALTWSAHYELPLKAIDASPWVSVELLSGGTARPHRTKTQVVDHLPIEIPFGKTTLRLRATDPAGNQGAVIEVEVERKKPSPHLQKFALGGNRFKITSDLKIPPHDALVLPPGAAIEIAKGKAILIRGTLLAPGTSEARITLEGDAWLGITLVGGAAKADLRYTTISGGRKERGGALAITGGGQLRAVECVFDNNMASKSGGALHVRGTVGRPGVVDLEHVRFEHNHSGGEGGAINFNTLSRGTLADCTFERNDSQSFGGAVVAIGAQGPTSTEVTIREGRFLLNRSAWGGGLQVGRNARVRLVGGHFESNQASKYGGGAYMRGRSESQRARLVMDGTRFVHNRAVSGGGLHVHSFAEARLKGGVFERNTATRYGGGVMILGSKGYLNAVDLKGVHFDSNTAHSGGGLNANYFSATRVDGCVFVRNQAPQGWGGGVCVVGKDTEPSRFDLVGCRFKGNVSKRLHGEDVRVASNVLFDPQHLVASGVRHNRSSTAASVHPARPTDSHTPAHVKAARRPPVTPPPARPKASPSSPKASPSSPKASPSSPKASPGEAREPFHAKKRIPDPPPTRGMIINIEDDFGRALAHYIAAAANKDYHALRDRPYGGSHRRKSYTSKIQFPDAVSVRIWDTGRKHYTSVTINNTAPDDEAHEAFDATVDRLAGHLSKKWRRADNERKSGSRITVFAHPNPPVVIRVTYMRFKTRKGMRSSVMVFFH
jgi:hypothetical protein